VIGFGVSSSAGAGSVFSSSFSSSGSLGVSSSVVGTGGSVSLTVIVIDYFVLRPKSSYKVMIILIFSSFSVNALEERSISALLLKTIKLGEETPIFMF
jgi:ABC-type Fe3+-siderophore transport system permease subunit